MTVVWEWEKQSPSYANYGNANQWTVHAGLRSLARESAQNSNDARLSAGVDRAELVYSFIRLSGAARERFEESIGWTAQLRPHLTAMAEAAGGAIFAGQLKSGLAAVDASDALVLLRIADYGAIGLTGPEFADGDPDGFGNFAKLCRLDLFSGKDKTSGGSFGLGKAVYWRFSRLQTVLFNSTLREQDAVNGSWRSRLFGVNQGVVHRLDGTNYQGRGFFGHPTRSGYVGSVWDHDDLADALCLTRPDNRPGTSALLVGFYDPDEPEKGEDTTELRKMAADLSAAIEEEFWPLLTRDRLRVRVEVIDNGNNVYDHVVDPADQYTELTHALRKFDSGQIDETLEDVGDIVVRDVPIRISQRIDADDPHPPFIHTAKLVVTLSDDEKDSLENKVCLFRQPEMVVQTIDKEYEGRTYHAFLLAGSSIHPGEESVDDERADDFLRFAEPPAHDQWIPRGGRTQTSQANLNPHYRAPWNPHLRGIESSILDRLSELFGAPPVVGDKPPKSIFKNLTFLRGDAGDGASGAHVIRKPTIDIQKAEVVDGRWHVTFDVKAKNRDEGWLITPKLTFIGLDRSHADTDWESFEVDDPEPGTPPGTVLLPGKPRGRTLKATVRAVSVADLPIPAIESAIDVRVKYADIAPPVKAQEVAG